MLCEYNIVFWVKNTKCRRACLLNPIIHTHGIHAYRIHKRIHTKLLTVVSLGIGCHFLLMSSTLFQFFHNTFVTF